MILSGELAQELKQTYQKLNNRGEMPSKSQLAQYHETFMRRFHRLCRSPHGMAMIFHPTVHAEAKEARVDIRDPIYGNSREGGVGTELLSLLEKLISGRTTVQNEGTRKSFAASGAFDARETVLCVDLVNRVNPDTPSGFTHKHSTWP